MDFQPSNIRIGTIEDFLEWVHKQTHPDNSIQVFYADNIMDDFGHKSSSLYDISIGGKSAHLPECQKITVYNISEPNESLSATIEYLTSTLGHFTRIVWLIVNHSYQDCGCRLDWCLRCERHGGPLAEIQRAAAAYFHHLGGFTKSNLKMLNIAAGNYPFDHPHIDDVCTTTFDLIMYRNPDTEAWLSHSCKILMRDPHGYIEPFYDSSENSWECFPLENTSDIENRSLLSNSQYHAFE